MKSAPRACTISMPKTITQIRPYDGTKDEKKTQKQ